MFVLYYSTFVCICQPPLFFEFEKGVTGGVIPAPYAGFPTAKDVSGVRQLRYGAFLCDEVTLL